MGGYRHLFGPVPSRRLGMSLGVDLVPAKTCTQDCLFCECGRTTALTDERREYAPRAEVEKELRHFFASHPAPEVVTFSGAGEPTLSSVIGLVIADIRSVAPGLPVAVLTNGSLLFRSDVRKDILDADRVIPSLNASSEEVFRRINRPLQGMSLASHVEGLVSFRREYKGRLDLEVFILPGVNDGEGELRGLKAAIEKIKPDTVQLNTLDRPGTDPACRPASREFLEGIVRAWGLPNAVIVSRAAPGSAAPGRKTGDEFQNAIFETIRRRPCTLEDLSVMLGLPERDIRAHLAGLRGRCRIREEKRDRGVFYQAEAEDQE